MIANWAEAVQYDAKVVALYESGEFRVSNLEHLRDSLV